MKKIKLSFVFLFLFTVSSFVFISCGEADSDVCSAEAAQETYLQAINTFSNNPTRATCNNLKSTANAFIDAAESCGGFDASSAHNIINQIDCSDF